MRPPARWLAAAALLCAFGACIAAPAPEPCGCGPERAPAPEPAPPHPVETAGAPAAAPGPADAPDAEAAADSVASGGGTAGLPDFADPTWKRLASRAGTYEVCWRSLSGVVPRNQDFTMEVWVLRDGTPAEAAHLGVNAWMPDHGHGMLRQPRAEPRGDGSFLVEGMLLHMRGHWTLLFDVLEGTLAETAEDGLDL